MLELNDTLLVNVESPLTFRRLKEEDPVVAIPTIPVIKPASIDTTDDHYSCDNYCNYIIT